MIGVFFGTPNVYRPQWHPEPPPLARPGLLQTVSPVPTRKPDSSLAPWFEWSWTMGHPWLALKRPLLTPPGKVGLPIPPPINPVSMKPWLQPDWTMDAPWQVRKLTAILPSAVSAPTPPPTITPLVNVSNFFQAWALTAPWIVPAPKFTPDASILWKNTPAAFAWHQRVPDWELRAPWRNVVDKPFTPDASVPPIRPMDTVKWFQRIADWSSDAPPWQALRVQILLPLGTPGLSIPPPMSPINMAPWLQPAWGMDATWQWQKIVLQTPASTVTIFPPPTRNPDANWLAQFFPFWDLRAPWSVPAPKYTPDASRPPTVASPINLSPFFPSWMLTSPWSIPAPTVAPSTILLPPTMAPTANLSPFFVAWALTSPWNVPLNTRLPDASVPPLRPMDARRWFQQVPDWQMDAPWQWQQILRQIPTATTARLALIDLFMVRCARTSPLLVIGAQTTLVTVRLTKMLTQTLIL